MASAPHAALLCCLNKDPFADGRVSLSLTGHPGNEEVEMIYQLLNPAPHFREVVDAARSVILAGGTMSPVCILGSSYDMD